MTMSPETAPLLDPLGGEAPPRRMLPMTPFLTTLGEIVKFGLQGFRGLPTAFRLYPTEVIRQAGLVVLSSALVLWTFMLTIGFIAGLVGSYILASLGAQDYLGLFIAIAVIQAVSAPTFGWIFAAKVGCGYTAEIGTMRITEEIDALAVMGMQPKVYLVSTRIAATLIVIPFVWLAGVGAILLGAYLVGQVTLQTSSDGGYFDLLWTFQRPIDLFLALTWAMVTLLCLVVIACYFGYHAEGGPVGVGKATARSMMFNMVVVSIQTGIFYQLFWGVNIPLPIAN
jgi:phospholipid/cholesterol/gamma-HCH transport system permease protein